ncbi:predicted protein [Sclerotinia sclerotiorum 1980 UF-70]|uniref:F-box domain-containing protein n=2 Tax=Sclerotinia sclerotiorum (strain ATCC 18683 / 1980 / Ss-1) TaxID=665079 RepID=A7EM08_SCLS1|nr:predicted protein [Sclerotinia sclerotiorum 1980 UF-70]APA14460.1 hypothetical protein sscle_13g092300 [Sclerotinia sclerotiorum 1980 UF-70]EDO03874.1 predicted protein [Sclerotinia sclerotiorum 1980 UF-70]
MPNNADMKIAGHTWQMTTQSSRPILSNRYRLRAKTNVAPRSKPAKKFMYRVKNKRTRDTAISTQAKQVKVRQAGEARVAQGYKRKWKAITASKQQKDIIVPSLRHLSAVRYLTLAQISVVRRHNSVLKIVPTAEEESEGEPEYFSAPSSLLIDGRETKRRRGDVEPTQSSPAPDEGETKRLETNRRSINEHYQDEDEDVQEITSQDWLKSVIKTRPAKSFNNLPDSIILQILDTLYEQDDERLVSSVCFGLTCRRCWSIFKMRWCCLAGT